MRFRKDISNFVNFWNKNKVVNDILVSHLINVKPFMINLISFERKYFSALVMYR